MRAEGPGHGGCGQALVRMGRSLEGSWRRRAAYSERGGEWRGAVGMDSTVLGCLWLWSEEREAPRLVLACGADWLILTGPVEGKRGLEGRSVVPPVLQVQGPQDPGGGSERAWG